MRVTIAGVEFSSPVIAASGTFGYGVEFEDIVSLDDRAVQQILRQVDSRELAVAMKGVDPTVAGKVTSNMSSRAAENLRDEIEVLPTLKKAQIAEARTGIVRIIRNLEESGDIVINRLSDDLD